jgi:hypothetical protein
VIIRKKFYTPKFRVLQLALTTAYHPQSDGQSERVNQCVEMYLRCAIYDNSTKWKQWLPLAEFWYNSSYHTALGCSPFKALYGYDSVFPAAPIVVVGVDQSMEELFQECTTYSELLKNRLATAQNRMKIQADKHRLDWEFQVGDKVLLKLQPYVQNSVVSRSHPKLAFKFFGPFTILQRVGSVANRLELPSTTLIHPVFHVSQLKQFIPNYTPVFSDISQRYTPVFSDISQRVDLSSETVKPLQIVDRPLVKKGNKLVIHVQVVWSDFSTDATTWEDFDVLKNRFLEVLDWGQSTSGGGKDVSTVACA